LTEDALTAMHKGIGVSTTRARLQHLFGAEYRFEFHRLTQGLAVVVALPWRQAGGGGRDTGWVATPAASPGAPANDIDGQSPATAVEIMSRFSNVLRVQP